MTSIQMTDRDIAAAISALRTVAKVIGSLGDDERARELRAIANDINDQRAGEPAAYRKYL